MFRGARFSLAVHRAILVVASALVPYQRRNEWLKEWNAELWYVFDDEERSARAATPFCLGAFRDAGWLRRQSVSKQLDGLAGRQSPILCLAVLAAMTAISLWLAAALPTVAVSAWRKPALAHLLVLSLALLILVSTGRAEAGPPSVGGPLFWPFVGVKLGLLAVIVFFGTFDLGWLVSQSGLQPLASLVGYILAFRWALKDQRRRCPKCLRLLTGPVRIGHPGRTLLEWYGTEFMCTKGHGILHAPELARNSYSVSRWINLDTSWRELFR